MGPTALLPLRRKAYWGFFRPKNPTASAGCKPANLGTKGQHATSRPPKPLWVCRIRKGFRQSSRPQYRPKHRYLSLLFTGIVFSSLGLWRWYTTFWKNLLFFWILSIALIFFKKYHVSEFGSTFFLRWNKKKYQIWWTLGGWEQLFLMGLQDWALLLISPEDGSKYDLRNAVLLGS
jgi:hypothetical protein